MRHVAPRRRAASRPRWPRVARCTVSALRWRTRIMRSTSSLRISSEYLPDMPRYAAWMRAAALFWSSSMRSRSSFLRRAIWRAT